MNKSLKERFWEKVNKNGAIHPICGQCWEWVGGKRHGYGQISAGRRAEGVLQTHRVAWVLETGIFPELCVLHKCDNRACIRFSHLFLGTAKDNTQDMMKKERGNNPKGAEHYYAKLKEIDIKNIRKDYKKGRITQQSLADKYSVCHAQISGIILRKSWKHVV